MALTKQQYANLGDEQGNVNDPAAFRSENLAEKMSSTLLPRMRVTKEGGLHPENSAEMR